MRSTQSALTRSTLQAAADDFLSALSRLGDSVAQATRHHGAHLMKEARFEAIIPPKGQARVFHQEPVLQRTQIKLPSHHIELAFEAAWMAWEKERRQNVCTTKEALARVGQLLSKGKAVEEGCGVHILGQIWQGPGSAFSISLRPEGMASTDALALALPENASIAHHLIQDTAFLQGLASGPKWEVTWGLSPARQKLLVQAPSADIALKIAALHKSNRLACPHYQKTANVSVRSLA